MSNTASKNAHNLILPVKQTRSREQMESIISAGLELLKEHSFDELKVEQIAAKAGCSPGTIYKRFKDKDSLIEVLAQTIQEEMLQSETWESAAIEMNMATSIHELVNAVVVYHVSLYRKHEGVMRAMIARHLSKQNLPRPIQEAGQKIIEHALERALAFCPDRIPEEVFKRSFRIAMQMMNGMVIHMIILSPGPIHLNDDAIFTSLSRSVLAIINCCQPENDADKLKISEA